MLYCCERQQLCKNCQRTHSITAIQLKTETNKEACGCCPNQFLDGEVQQMASGMGNRQNHLPLETQAASYSAVQLLSRTGFGVWLLFARKISPDLGSLASHYLGNLTS